jgi:hypothetical protein
MATDQTLLLQGEKMTWRELGEQIVVLDLATSRYLSIGGPGAFIWKRLSKGATLTELVDLVVAEYDIDEATALADTETFLADLRARSLLA